MGDTRKRAAILAVASRLFAEKGYGNTSTSEIAREAGVAEGTLYHHFGSKDGIFRIIYEETANGYLDAVEGLARKGNPGAETLQAIIRFHFDYLELHAKQFLVILRDLPAHLDKDRSASASIGKKKFGRLTELLTEVLERGAADGTLALRHPPRDTAEMLRGILYGTTRHKMLDIIDVPFPRLAAMIADFCGEALAAAPETRQRKLGGGPA